MDDIKKNLELLKAALDKATTKGVFNLVEANQIIVAIANIERQLQDSLESAETQLRNG